MLYAIAWTLVRAVLKVFCAAETCGAENLPSSGGAIIACNHVSYLDPPLAAVSVTRRLKFMAKSDLFSIPVLGRLISALGAFPIDRGKVDRSGLRTAERFLREGYAVLVFPEGTRSPDGRLQQAEPGLGLLALRTRAPVVPMAVLGTDRVLPRHSALPRPGRLKVRIGPPLTFPEHYGKQITRQAIEEVTARTMQAIAGLLPPDRRPLAPS